MGIKNGSIHKRAGIRGTKVDIGLCADLGAPVVATTNRLVTVVDWENGSLTIANQPDVPRNPTCTLTDANSSVTAGTITFNGKGPEGDIISEVATAAQARAGFTGVKMFAHVTSIVIAGSVGQQAATDTVVAGVGNVVALPSPIEAASQVRHVFLAAVRIAAPVVAVGRYKSGVNVSASTYDGTKQLRVWYSPGLASSTR